MFTWEYHQILRYIDSDIFLKDVTFFLLLGVFFMLNQLVVKVNDPIKKKWSSTVLGAVTATCFCGLSALHLILMVLGNSLILQYGYKRWRHTMSFVYSYIQLCAIFLVNYQRHHVVDRDVAVCALMMIMFLKLVHLAGEVQDTFLSHETNSEANPRMKVYADLTISDVFHYSFSYASLLTLYRYRTYYDWLHCPLHVYAKRVRTTVLRVVDVCLLFVCRLPILLYTPKEYILTDDFFKKPLFYKFSYSTCCGVDVYLMVYSILVLNDILCISSGLGAYPTATKPGICVGPTGKFDLLDKMASCPEKAQLQDYTFETVRNINVFKSAFAPTLRDFWRNYNCCAHHFFVINVYKKFPLKRLRLPATFLMSALWHGYYLGWYVGMLSSAVYIEAEDIWESLFRKHAAGNKRKIIDAIFWLSQFITNSHMFLAMFYLKSSVNVYHAFSALHFLPVIYPVAMLAIGTYIRFAF